MFECRKIRFSIPIPRCWKYQWSPQKNRNCEEKKCESKVGNHKLQSKCSFDFCLFVGGIETGIMIIPNEFFDFSSSSYRRLHRMQWYLSSGCSFLYFSNWFDIVTQVQMGLWGYSKASINSLHAMNVRNDPGCSGEAFKLIHNEEQKERTTKNKLQTYRERERE